jgi:hypothetical protein
MAPGSRFPCGSFPLYGGRASRRRLPDLHGWRLRASADFDAVDGFDETFVGWGHEDADMVLRLSRVDVRRKSGDFATEVFHLWHPEQSRASELANMHRVEARMVSGEVKAVRGVSSHPSDGERVMVVASHV